MKKHKILSVLVVMFIVSMSLIGIAHAGLNDGLAAYYPFNGNANDESCNGNHGVEYGGVSYTDGVIDKAANFDGVDDFIEIFPYSDVSGIGDFTISVWTYLMNWKEQSYINSKDRQYIFDGHTHSKTAISNFYRPGFCLIYDIDEIHNTICYNDSKDLEQNTKMDIKGAWHHNLFMRINNIDYTYFDGKLIDSTYYINNKRNDLLDMQHTWFIGTFSGNNPNYEYIKNGFNYSYYGLLDELRIYNRAISEDEIQQLYNKENTCEDRYDEGYQAGKQACIDAPLSCGIAKYLIFSNNANPVIQSGSSVNVYGNPEINRITLKSGASAKLINFVGSNEVTIQADSTLFNVSRSGAAVTIKDSNGTILTIPATKTAQTIIFNDKTLTLVINNNQVMLGEQVVNLTPSSIL